MPLDLHPDAKKRFNELADALVPHLLNGWPSRSSSHGFHANLYIPDSVSSGAIRTAECRDLDGDTGYLVRGQPEKADEALGLYGTHYVALNKLAERVQTLRCLRDMLSFTFVRGQILQWLCDRHEQRTDASMVDSLLIAGDAAVQDHDIWMPVAYLYIQSTFDVGQIRFQTWTPRIFERWIAEDYSQLSDDERSAVMREITRQRKRLQGSAAATIKITAERERAYKLALGRAAVAVGILRLYARANFRADETSRCALSGTAHIDEYNTFRMDGDRVLEDSSGVVDLGIHFG